MPKEKLTLSVDSEVVEKAKRLGLNLSEIAEVALRGFSFSAKEAESSALYQSYKALFDAMKPVLNLYDASVKIASPEIKDKTGDVLGLEDIMLCPDGTFYAETFETAFADVGQIPTYAFCSPKEILSNLVDALEKSSTRRKDTIRELEMARRIVNAIASTMQSGAEPKTRAGTKAQGRKGTQLQKIKAAQKPKET
jgi:hypothetical protein